jgi:hypothetical protein
MFNFHKTAAQPFFYKGKLSQTFTGSLEECVKAVLTGASTFDPDGSWEQIINGTKTRLPNEPPVISRARDIFTKSAGSKKRFRLINEWGPRRGDDIVIIEY